MLSQKITDELLQSMLSKKIDFNELISFLDTYPFIVDYLNNNYYKMDFTFFDPPIGQYVLCDEKNYDFNLASRSQKTPSSLEIPLIFILFANNPSKYKELCFYLKISPFHSCFLNMNNKKHLLLGFNLFNILNIKIPQNNISEIPIKINNTEQFMNFYQEKIDRNGYASVYCDSLFPLFNFKINIDEMLYDNNYMVFDSRKLIIYIFDKKLECTFKNLNELNNHEKLPLENLIAYKIKNQEINFEMDSNTFIDLLILKNYFIKDSNGLSFCNQLFEKNPEIFSKDILALIFLKNKLLHEEITKKIQFKSNKENVNMNNDVVLSNSQPDVKETLISNLNELNQFSQKLLNNDIFVKNIFDELLIHLDTTTKDNAIDYFKENIEERITIENMMSKYIPTILNNYLSIPEHLRKNENNPFLEMTVSQLKKIISEIEQIEVSIMSEDMKKMKIFGKFLDNKLSSDNLNNIIKLN